MIYCFSGTGNSLGVARRLSKALGERLLPMTEALGTAPDFASPEEPLGLVFPVYGWGLPRFVETFVEALPHPAGATPRYVFAVLTFGDDIGRTDRLLSRALARRGWQLAAVFSVQLRNTYVCLPGFDVDTPQVAAEKAQRAAVQLETIVPRIAAREASTPADIVPGACAGLKSYVLRPLFNALLISDRHFRAETVRCTGCGRCARVCPLHNISLDEATRTPRWQGHCTHCLACYHACPQHAVAYGFFTGKKGQVGINSYFRGPQGAAKDNL